ncbi:MAG TPA: hypothetical protein VFF14_10730 [Candidatus Deferrimicrobium sp.]|nr:hypothetical protein [Candidatus Deferrimicrobium sp.]
MHQNDLRSDTKPTQERLTVMSKAKVEDINQALEVISQVVVHGSI